MVKRKKKVISGKISSGMIFIGDPSYLSGPSDIRLNEKGESYNAIPVDPHNPFRRFEDVTEITDKTGDYELEMLPFVPGRGAVLLTEGIQEGKFEVKKKIKDGKLVEIKLVIKG